MKKCPECGKEISGETIQGVCPKCLMKVGLGSGPAPIGMELPRLEELRERFPQLEILELIGKGGMGAVYKARQKELDRFVAVKILPPGVSDDPAFAERFAREAKALAKLYHPNIVAIHDFGQANGLFYFVMEYVDGMNLRQLLHTGRIAPREALAIVPQICDALQYAHDLGIVHRDIKPENILLDRRGQVKVADFGLAKLVGRTEPVADETAASLTMLTEAGKVVGTPQYMAPEQVDRPSEVDHRADIYSLGVVFYQMLTGELPKGDFAPPSKSVVIDVRLDQVVLRALEQRPELRYQQVSEVKTMVETIVGTPPLSPPHAADRGGPLSDSIVKSESALLRVQESPSDMVSYPTSGEVILYTDRLVVSSGSSHHSISLADIRAFGQAVLSFWCRPVAHRYVTLDFDEGGQRRRLIFLAGSSMFRLPGSTRLHATEWIAAIHHAIRSATGRDVPISNIPIVVPVKKGWVLFVSLLALILETTADLQKFTLLSIAFDSGFNSKTSFNRIFKEFTGSSPSDFIKK